MSLWQIKSLPVPCLLAPGALVGIWVTNKQKYLRFTRTELFPHWSMELMAEWYWVKVTRKGELVTDLDEGQRGAEGEDIRGGLFLDHTAPASWLGMGAPLFQAWRQELGAKYLTPQALNN